MRFFSRAQTIKLPAWRSISCESPPRPSNGPPLLSRWAAASAAYSPYAGPANPELGLLFGSGALCWAASSLALLDIISWLDLSLSVSATESKGNGLLSSETQRHTGGPSYHTSTGPLGTGIRSRWATAGSCMNEATSGGGWKRGFSAPVSSRNCRRQRR